MDNIKDKKIIELFLKNPGRVGSVAASSPFLAKEITKRADFSQAKCVVEFGSGTGSITKNILKALPSNCLLLCFEVEPEFAKKLKNEIRDPRVKIICDSAENIGKYLRQLKIEKVDYVISTIPLTTLPYRIMKEILKLSFQYLRSGGKYIQVQYSLLGRRYLRMFFPEMDINFVFLNLPPAFVYVCVKS